MQGEMDTYLDTVGNQIRWKAARKLIRQELQGHIEEKKREALTNSPDTTEAEHMAVKAMGDPAETGRKLDKLHRPKLDIWMLASIAVLIVFGMWILYIGFTRLDHPYFFTIQNQWLIFRIIGLAIGAACVFINFRWLFRKRIFLIIIGCTGIAGMLFINLSNPYWARWTISNDWLTFIGYISLILVIMTAAGLAGRVRRKGWAGILLAIVLLLGAIALNLLRENREWMITACFIVSAIAILWASKARVSWKILATVLMAAGLAPYIIDHSDFIRTFFTAPQYVGILGGESSRLQAAFQNIQLIGQAPGFTGTSLIACADTMAYVLLRLGLLPGIILAGAFGILLWRMIRACLRIQDTSGRVLATGLAAFITAMTAANLLLNVLFIGSSGSYLPFLSDFGPEFVVAAVMSGIILGLYRKKDLYPANELTGAEGKSVLFG